MRSNWFNILFVKTLSVLSRIKFYDFQDLLIFILLKLFHFISKTIPTEIQLRGFMFECFVEYFSHNFHPYFACFEVSVCVPVYLDFHVFNVAQFSFLCLFFYFVSSVPLFVCFTCPVSVYRLSQ